MTRRSPAREWRHRSRRLAVVGLVVLAVGCAETQPTRFYTLSGLHAPPDASLTLPRGRVVGVGPVSLPDYLDRPQIVTRTAANQARLAEFDSWIEPLSSMVPRVLADNLSTLLDTDDVLTLPQRRAIRLAYHAEVDVSRFDFDATGGAVLDARWYLLDGRERLLDSGRATLTEPAADAGDYAAIVAAMSRALGALSEQIAAAILIHARS